MFVKLSDVLILRGISDMGCNAADVHKAVYRCPKQRFQLENDAMHC